MLTPFVYATTIILMSKMLGFENAVKKGLVLPKTPGPPVSVSVHVNTKLKNDFLPYFRMPPLFPANIAVS